MKNRNNKSFNFQIVKIGFLFLIMILMVSCSKDKSSGVNVETGKMTATINNVKYTLNISNISKIVSHDTTSLTIEGLTSDSSKSIGFYFKEIKWIWYKNLLLRIIIRFVRRIYSSGIF